ncbi:MAG: bifunctional ornithine acetyltransferase/N-acetylglutamate synthase [Acidimicrobiales bacterium mtb01]|nr:bifunctional glutamate N-acetyltransferase/amino-acid acetyltransferase ArgJ [Actinomycetota bacterium]TEX47805.1 MAG: bifunctional ornithine acetyltransferase/N-acetylglutamate synthase [Acidimicrobiales bacterium mtb01]
MVALPAGFRSFVTNVGIKDDTKDFTIVACDAPVAAAGVFTRSRFAGPSVLVSREHLADRSARAVAVISKNANVANGPVGLEHAREVAAGVASHLGCAPSDVLIASTGVIGRVYPIERIRTGLGRLPLPLPDSNADDVARGIMTTDTVPKIAEATVAGSSARVVGVAKGVGMIEPDMATLITLAFTDAAVDGATLDAIWRRVIDHTFNCVSVDTDTSTSDTAIVLASGAAGPVDHSALESALHDVALSLTKQVARDGEGAETLIEVRVDRARDAEQAKTVAKSIVNSPLVKTAIHGADPNWGRVAMAVGKCSQYTDIDQEKVVIRFGSQEVYPSPVDGGGLARLAEYMKGDDVLIHVSLNTGDADATVWGCDLTDGYVRINADYTT